MVIVHRFLQSSDGDTKKNWLVKRFGFNVFAHLSSQWPHVRGKYVSG